MNRILLCNHMPRLSQRRALCLLCPAGLPNVQRSFATDENARKRRPHRYWADLANQKAFLDSVTNHGQCKWSEVTYNTIKDAGGGTLLNRYNGNLVELLRVHYAEAADTVFADESLGAQKPKRRGHWSSLERQREFFDEFAKKRGIMSPQDWKSVRRADVETAGGAGLLRLHSGLLSALEKVYPEHEWNAFHRRYIPSPAWDDVTFCRRFLTRIAESRGFRPEDVGRWKEVTNRQVSNDGGGGLLRKHSHSLRSALAESFPTAGFDDISDSECRPKVKSSHWSVQENRRAFFDNVATELEIRQDSDWFNVTTVQLMKFSGASRILQKAGGSVLTALCDAYPEKKFDETSRVKVSQRFWEKKENRLAFLERIADKFAIRQPEDWKRVTRTQVCEEGGSSLFNFYPNLLDALSDLYPDEFDVLSCRTTVPSSYWESTANIIQFMDKLKKELKIKEAEDWARVAQFQIKAAGGSGLLRKMSFREALELAYPDEKWSLVSWGGSKKATQRQLYVQMTEVLPGATLLEDHRHSALSRDVREKGDLELDIFLPDHDVAIEYNGYHHYFELPFFGPVQQYQLRDEEKRKLCEQNGIRLIVIPFWWDKSKESLAATLYKEIPSLLESHAVPAELMKSITTGDIKPIPSEPPASIVSKRESSGDRRIAQLPHVWNDSIDPSGMLVCKRLEGVSVRWIEGQLSTRFGRIIQCPAAWKSQLPPMDLDGILWMGDDSLGKLANIVGGKRTLSDEQVVLDNWENIQLYAVDIGEVGSRFSRRFEVLSGLSENSVFKVLKHSECRGKEHLRSLLEQADSNGLLLRNPSSIYRLSSKFWQDGTIRVQQLQTASVTVVGRAAKTRGLLIKSEVGKTQVARCSDHQYFHLKDGDQVKVSHLGKWSTGRYKHPFIAT